MSNNIVIASNLMSSGKNDSRNRFVAFAPRNDGFILYFSGVLIPMYLKIIVGET